MMERRDSVSFDQSTNRGLTFAETLKLRVVFAETFAQRATFNNVQSLLFNFASFKNYRILHLLIIGIILAPVV